MCDPGSGLEDAVKSTDLTVNPLIYSLRNKDVKTALKRAIVTKLRFYPK